jgi:hypothetical protein
MDAHTQPQPTRSMLPCIYMVLVCRMYDQTGTGSVNFEEFNQLHMFIVQTQNDFRMIDLNKDGLLSKAEVSDALNQAGVFLKSLVCEGQLDIEFALRSLHAALSPRVNVG